MSKTIVILQSTYIPWKGFFDLINLSDEFIFYDEMQFIKRKWHNRNLIKTRHGLKWLTIPVNVKGRYHQKINETMINDFHWAERHWEMIRHAYHKAPCFRQYEDAIKLLFEQAATFRYITEVNELFIKKLCVILDIRTHFSRDRDYVFKGDKSERLLNICEQAGATTYLSGPSAKDYLDEALFQKAGINVLWMDYGGYSAYQQLYPPFEHGVTVLDLLFHTGSSAGSYLKTTKKMPVCMESVL